MNQLLPTVQARRAQESLTEYLRTTFALADRDVQAALDRFLSDPKDGIFKGPFIRTRTPFKPQPGGGDALEITPGKFEPYGHQARAFKRLSSRHLGEGKRPQPTLVTTGTGSGKTESFLYPILDHVVRHRRHGGTGVSALILYPMNALATDQAQRLARMITEDPQLGGIRAGIYVGDQGDKKRSRVSAEGLINDRESMQSNPPDILLTNYKMLDQMLLRVRDQPIWSESALSLRYLVLDEFHTYDGAQGTDVAMLLRRLGAKLKSLWPDDHPTISDEDRARPLGLMTPVATSATLGDKNDPGRILTFAHTVFGEEFDDDAVVTESRFSVDEWAALPGADLTSEQAALVPIESPQGIDIARALSWIEAADTDDERALRALATLYEEHTSDDEVAGSSGSADWSQLRTILGNDTTRLLTLAKGHPWIRAFYEATTSATHIADLAAEFTGSRSEAAQKYLGHIVAGLSLIRASERLAAPTVDVNMWVRALTRIDRSAGGETEFAWSDDGHLITDSARSWDDNSARERFPAIFCRNCGRNGWGVVKAAVGNQLAAPDEDTNIRRESMSKNSRYRALISAGGEADEYAFSGGNVDVLHENLAAFNVRERNFVDPKKVFGSATIPDDLAEAFGAGDILPVLCFQGSDAEEKSKGEYCPACGERDAIRFLGAAVATLLSVSLSTLFGDENIDDHEKKSLVFTDSVQDAAHRAGFVESRSHVLTLRNVIAEAVGESCTLDALAGRIITLAGDDSAKRYRVLPPGFSTDRFADVRAWWQQPERSNRRAVDKVMNRLSFDAALEFGLQTRFGRTLSTTGTINAEVDLPDTGVLERLAAEVFGDAGELGGLLDLEVADETGEGATSARKRVAWVRGVVERLRTQGAIHHPWLSRYVASGGKRVWIWGKRKRDQGMPAFPHGRSAPTFAVTGMPRRSIGGRSGSEFDMVESNQGWFGRYAARTFGITATHGAGLTKLLLQRLAADGILRAVPVPDFDALAYGIDQSRIRLERAFTDPEEPSADLVCRVCRTSFAAAARTRDELDGTPCLMVGCGGTLAVTAVEPNFYRRLYTSSHMARIVAREHSSMLDSTERTEFEDGFKRGSDDPSAPNVLVATPTLEMGIDIGDLSTVMLGSLPETVASYVQRVGRAGRLTGNAFNLAVVGSGGQELRSIHDPLSIINGSVQPPATYLDAVEIIKRQYIAFLMDRLAQAPGAMPVEGVGHVFGAEPGKSEFLNSVIDLNSRDHAELLAEFLSGFGDLIDQAKAELIAWATPTQDASGAVMTDAGAAAGRDSVCGLTSTLWKAHLAYRSEIESLRNQLDEIRGTLANLQAEAESPAESTDAKVAYQQALSAERATDRRLSDEQKRYWIEALETYQLLPNYTLLDDTTQLDVSVRWRDEDTQQYESERIEFDRGARQALRDFAPGSTFYGRSMAVRIDAVELGPNRQELYAMRFCAECGYTFDSRTGAQPPAQCPRCGDAGIADVGQQLQAVQLRKVSAMVNRDESRISDADDERRLRSYTIVSTADVDRSSMGERWYVDRYGFGVSYLNSVTVTTTNFGPRGQGQEILASGDTIVNSGFVVCDHCGQLDSSTNGNQRTDHRPWCPKRDEFEESNLSLVLTHRLTTQGALIRLPENLLVGEHDALPTLVASIRLGLAKHLGGDPDHIDIIATKEPLDGGGAVDALLLHDIVPGGTGYLADLQDPVTVWKVLHEAWQHLTDCECRDQNLWACPKCLLPYQPRTTTVSRALGEKKLLELLLAGRPADVLSGVFDVDEEAIWTVTAEAPQAMDPESFLERRFRKVFRDRLERANIDVVDKPAPTGTELEIHQLGSGVKWRLIPQVNLGRTKPDFLLRCNSSNLPEVAIYTDGRAYHASNAVNRLADDAGKRAWVRGQGKRVVAITSADVDAAAVHGNSGSSADGADDLRTPSWLTPLITEKLLQSSGFGWTAQASDALGNPIEVLVGLIQSVNSGQLAIPSWIEAAANGLPAIFAMQPADKTNVEVPLSGSIADLVVDDVLGTASLAPLVGTAPSDGHRIGFLWAYGPLRVLAAMADATATTFDVAVILDDRESAVALGDDFTSAWLEWLRISNVVGFSSPGKSVEISTVTASLGDRGARADSHVVAEEAATSAIGGVDVVMVDGNEVTLSDEWSTFFTQEDLFSPNELDFARRLAASGIESVPEWGHESDSGLSLDFAWPDRKLGVLLDPIDGDEEDLRADGWTLVSATVDGVKTALDPDQERSSIGGDDGKSDDADQDTHEIEEAPER